MRSFTRCNSSGLWISRFIVRPSLKGYRERRRSMLPGSVVRPKSLPVSRREKACTAALFSAFVHDDATCLGHAVRVRHVELHHNFAANEFVRSYDELPNGRGGSLFVSHHVSIEKIVERLIIARPLGTIDDEKLDRGSARFELQAELFPQRGENGGRVRRERKGIVRWKRLMFVRSPTERKVELFRTARPVDHLSIEHS